MKIGASTLAGFKDDIDVNLDYFESLSLKYVEILHQFPNNNIDTDLLNSYNLNYTVHAPIVDINIASLDNIMRKAAVDRIKNSIDVANKIDASVVVVHPGIIPFLGRDFEDHIYKLANSSIEELGKYGEDLGVTVAIENMPDFEGFMYKSLDELNNTLEKYDMFMTLDIGHAYHTSHLPSEMYYERVKHIHIHDNNGDEDSHLSLGEGSIDLKSIIESYEKNNYDGIYTIEVNDTDSVQNSLKYLKNLK